VQDVRSCLDPGEFETPVGVFHSALPLVVLVEPEPEADRRIRLRREDVHAHDGSARDFEATEVEGASGRNTDIVPG